LGVKKRELPVRLNTHDNTSKKTIKMRKYKQEDNKIKLMEYKQANKDQGQLVSGILTTQRVSLNQDGVCSAIYKDYKNIYCLMHEFLLFLQCCYNTPPFTSSSQNRKYSLATCEQLWQQITTKLTTQPNN
jgi:hypothetical protein